MKKDILTFAVCVALTLFLIVPSLFEAKRHDPATHPPAVTGALVACQEFVKQRLADPESASFPWFKDRIQDKGAGLFIITSYVRSKKNTPDKPVTNFTCTVQGQTNEHFNLLKLDMDTGGVTERK